MNKHALALVVAALAAIAAVWIVTGDDAPPAPITPTGTAITAPGNAAPAAAEAASVAAAASGADTGAAANDLGRVAVPASGGGLVADAVAVRGRLVDGKGSPRAGVVLGLRSWAVTGDSGLAALPAPFAGRERGRKDEPTWTTNTDGAFMIPLAKDHDGFLSLVTADLVFAADKPGVIGKKGDQDLGDVVVLRGGAVSGVVQDERGQPVAGVKVTASVDALAFGTTSVATSQADGTFAIGMLRPGKWALRTASGKFLPTVEEFEVAAEEQRAGVVLVVRPGNAIAGQVVDDRGVGVAGMRVGSKRKEARGAVDIERFSADEATTTDAHGYFTLSRLAEEHVAVRAFGPGHSSATATDVAVGTGNLILRVERFGSVEGVLVDATGAPIAGSRVHAQAGRGGDGMLGHGDALLELDLDGIDGRLGATTGADGSFRLESVRPGATTIVARGKTHRPVRQSGVNVQPAQTTKDVRLVADLGASARVKVVDDAGKAVAGAQVHARRPQAARPSGGPTFRARAVAIEDGGEMAIGGGDQLGAATTDAEGIATIQGLPPGDVAIGATHAAFARAEDARVAMPKAGTVEASLTMRTPGVAEIAAVGTDGTPLVGVDVVIDTPDEPEAEPQRLTTGDGGIARATSLAPGVYRAALAKKAEARRFGDAMVFTGDGPETIASSAQTFAVAAGQSTRVELRRPVLAKVHGVVSAGGAPAAGISVELQGADAGGVPDLGGRSTKSGADGTFAFDDVEPGPWALAFGKENQVVKARHEFEVPANTLESRQDLTLRTGKLRVQAVAQGSGEGVEKATVELVRDDGAATAGAPPRQERRVMMVSMTLTNDGAGASPESTTMTVGGQRAQTDEDGLAEIDDVPVGTYTLRIRHRKHAPFERKGLVVVEGQLLDCGRVELAGAGMVRGKVVDATGKSPMLALVTSRRADAEDWSEPEMAQGGSYRLQGLAAGRYKVRAQAIGPTPGGYSPEVEVEVKAGETATADLQLPAN